MQFVYLASAVTLPGSPTRRVDAYEHDQMMAALVPAFAARGFDLVDLAWDDPHVDWARFDGVIIGTTWDYWDRAAAFLARLEQIACVSPVWNAPALVRWNSHKGYLRDLAARGVPIVPTLWMDKVTANNAGDAFSYFRMGDLVFKRQIGAGADGQHRLRPGAPLPDMPHPMMIQPFLKSVQTEGEYSFIFIDGELCHTLLKCAREGDYRVQSTYGGIERVVTPDPKDTAAAIACLTALKTIPLYARIDMVRGDKGRLMVMEAELIEPFLYPLQGPDLGPRLAEAVARRLI